MCFKDEEQRKAYDKLQKQLEGVPKFIKDFFKSKTQLRSKMSHIQYWSNYKQFFNYLINNEIIEKSSISEIVKEDIEQLKKTHISQYLNYCRDQGNSDVTVNFKLNSLSSLFSYFIDDEIIIKDITRGVAVDKPKKKPLKYATQDDVKELIHNLDTMKNEYDRIRNIAIVQLLFGSGIRLSELVGLDIQDLNLEDEIPNIRVVRKGGSTDTVDITHDARMSLEEYLIIRPERFTLDNQHILFISERKNRISQNTIRDFVSKYSDGKLNPHMFRKGLGMLMYNKSGDLHMVAEQLGHSSDRTTANWYVTTDRNRRASVMNDL